nr:MAG TPA: hypothetical protein [Caudoviricetes sp.]
MTLSAVRRPFASCRKTVVCASPAFWAATVGVRPSLILRIHCS